MQEDEISRTVRRCVDECGYSWATTCQIVGRMLGRVYTVSEAKLAYLFEK